MSQQQPVPGDPITQETPEIRDNAELSEEAQRTVSVVPVVIGVDNRPMAKITTSVSDKVPTVQFGNVVITVQHERFVDDLGDGIAGRQHRIDRTREQMRDTEFACGVERRLLQWAVDPASRVQNPITAQDAFAAPPAGYDAQAVTDPRTVAEQSVQQPPSTSSTSAVVPASTSGDNGPVVG